MLRNWLTCIDRKTKSLIFVRTTIFLFFTKLKVTLIWTIWCTHNDIVFEKKRFHLIYTAILKGVYWLSFGPYCLWRHEDTREVIRAASKALEVITLDIFAKNDAKITIGFGYDYFLMLVNFYVYCGHQSFEEEFDHVRSQRLQKILFSKRKEYLIY